MIAVMTRSVPVRRDALKRREALLDAAMDCFEERGFSVPMEEIADRAGVGRGTLYRNFADRVELAFAIVEREVERMGEGIDPELSLEEVLRPMVLRGARTSVLFTRMAVEVQLSDAQIASFRAIGARLETFMEPVAARARAAGRLAPHMGAAELVLAMRMLGGLIKTLRDPAELEEHVNRAMQLLIEGLRPR